VLKFIDTEKEPSPPIDWVRERSGCEYLPFCPACAIRMVPRKTLLKKKWGLSGDWKRGTTKKGREPKRYVASKPLFLLVPRAGVEPVRWGTTEGF